MGSVQTRLRLVAGLLVGLMALPSVAFQVRPVRVELGARQPSAQLVVSNPTERPVLIQAQVWSWSQEAGQERLDPAADLIVNPPIFELAPGAQQVVRVGLRQGLPPGQEQTWRLWLSQVATPGAAGEPGVQMLLRVSLPVFGAGEGLAGPQPRWQRQDRGATLVLANEGARHVHVRELRLQTEGEPARALGPCYALAGGVCRWTLPPEWQDRSVRAEADTSAGRLRTQLDGPRSP
jgi:fimbrial chaperone protein